MWGVTLAVQEDEAANPLNVGLLGTVSIVSGAQGLAHLVEEFGLARVATISLLKLHTRVLIFGAK